MNIENQPIKWQGTDEVRVKEMLYMIVDCCCVNELFREWYWREGCWLIGDVEKNESVLKRPWLTRIIGIQVIKDNRDK